MVDIQLDSSFWGVVVGALIGAAATILAALIPFVLRRDKDEPETGEPNDNPIQDKELLLKRETKINMSVQLVSHHQELSILVILERL